MGSITNYTEIKTLNHIFGRLVYVPAETIYLALFTDDPTEAGVLDYEPPRSNGYSRVETSFLVAANRTIIQDGQITMPQCSGGGWGTIRHWGIMDALTDGNMLAYGDLNNSLNTTDGYICNISDEDIQISTNVGNVSDYLVHISLDFMFRNGSLPIPSMYVGFCDGTPIDSDTGITIPELSGDNYSRVLFSDWSDASDGAIDNSSEIVFPTPSSDWNLITHSVICDAPILGNLLLYGPALPNQIAPAGEAVKYQAEEYIVTLD